MKMRFPSASVAARNFPLTLFLTAPLLFPFAKLTCGDRPIPTRKTVLFLGPGISKVLISVGWDKPQNFLYRARAFRPFGSFRTRSKRETNPSSGFCPTSFFRLSAARRKTPFPPPPPPKRAISRLYLATSSEPAEAVSGTKKALFPVEKFRPTPLFFRLRATELLQKISVRVLAPANPHLQRMIRRILRHAPPGPRTRLPTPSDGLPSMPLGRFSPNLGGGSNAVQLLDQPPIGIILSGVQHGEGTGGPFPLHGSNSSFFPAPTRIVHDQQFGVSSSSHFKPPSKLEEKRKKTPKPLRNPFRVFWKESRSRPPRPRAPEE